MKKRLAERIAENKRQGGGKSHRNFSIIITYIDEIKESLDAGWSRYIVWQQLKAEGIYKSGFQSFLNNLEKVLSDKPADGVFKNKTGKNEKEEQPNKSDDGENDDAGPVIARLPETPTFSYTNLKDRFNKE